MQSYENVFDQENILAHIKALDDDALKNTVHCWKTWSTSRNKWEGELERILLWKEAYPHDQKMLGDIWSEVFDLQSNTSDHIIFDIQTGGGGEESFFWVAKLCALMEKWAEQLGCAYEVMNTTQSSAILRVEGKNSHLLVSQEGVHRFVRQSPFDKNERVHTSFVTVRTSFDAEDKQVELHKKDVRIDTMRSQGAGGQHVNTTESAVRLTHIPSGIVVYCQNGRSQHGNKKAAWSILLKRLETLDEHKEAKVRPERQKKSYTYHFGRNEVLCHATGKSIGNVQNYLMGKISPLVLGMTSDDG